jgi:hypothetical protein
MIFNSQFYDSVARARRQPIEAVCQALHAKTRQDPEASPGIQPPIRPIIRLRSTLHRLSILAWVVLAVGRAAAAPPAPPLLTPTNESQVLVPFSISWSAVSDPSGIIGYNWQVSPSSNFTAVTLQDSTNGATQDTVSGLPNGTYFWRVQAVDGAFEQGAWSAPRSFTVTGAGPGEPGAPTLDPPLAYSTFHPMEVMRFHWSAVPDAATYVFQFSKDPSFPIATRGQFDNIPDTSYSFAIGDSDTGNYFARVIAVSADGIASVPSNVITFSVLFNNPLPPPPSPVSPANGSALTLPVTLTWTDVPNPQPSGYEIQIAKDSRFRTIEEDDPQLNGPSRTVLSLTSGTKFWRVRSFQGDSSPTTAAVTAWSRAGSFTISSAPPTPVSITPISNPLTSGTATFVAVQLTAAAPSGGSTVHLTSSNPAALPVPATVAMPGNIAWTQFQVTAGPVASPTPVTLAASLNGVTASVQVTVLPAALKSLTISPGTISGGAQPQAIVMLTGQAPASGAVVSLTSDSPAVAVPSTVTVEPGSYSVSFPLSTSPVNANTTATVTATWNGVSSQAQVTLTPQSAPASLTLSPASTSGSNGSFATVAIDSPTSTDQTLQVTSSNPAAASVPHSVTIPSGSTRGGFNISTTPVTTQTFVTISVSGGGVTRTAVLTLDPTPPPPQTARLTVTATGRSGERVSSSPSGINVAVGSTGSASFTLGTSVTLSITDGRDAIWSGACSSGGNKTKSCTFTLNGDASVNANVQ